MSDTINVDVISRSTASPVGWIPIINKWSPAKNVEVSEESARQLLQIGSLFIYIADTQTLLTGRNFREYFPDGGGGGGGGEGDKSRYTIKKETASSGEVTYKLMQSINGGSSAKVGDIVGLRGNQMLVNYDGNLVILNNAIANMKEEIDSHQAVDTSMSDSSVNAVQNKVIKKYVDDNVGDKVDKVSGKGLSTNDYTTEEKTKLRGLADIQSIGDGLSLDNGELSATGGGGTGDYDDLENQPSINNITLVGNKSLSDLGIAAESDIPTDLSDLTDDATHRVVTDTEKTTWNGKQSALDATQMNAVNSGITAADVSQITTNTSDISTINGIIGDINDTLEEVL